LGARPRTFTSPKEDVKVLARLIELPCAVDAAIVATAWQFPPFRQYEMELRGIGRWRSLAPKRMRRRLQLEQLEARCLLAGTVELVADLNHLADSLPGDLTPFSDRLYFRATPPFSGYKVWTVDRHNEVVLADLGGALESNAEGFTALNGELYLSARGAGLGQEVWKLDSAGQASLVADVWPGAGDSLPREFLLFQNELYFTAAGVVLSHGLDGVQ
jgi:ELWxxDGT repeat protein